MSLIYDVNGNILGNNLISNSKENLNTNNVQMNNSKKQISKQTCFQGKSEQIKFEQSFKQMKLLCMNHDQKKAKYNFFEKNEQKFLCSKCAIELAQNGVQVFEIKRKEICEQSNITEESQDKNEQSGSLLDQTLIMIRQREIETFLLSVNEQRVKFQKFKTDLDTQKKNQAQKQKEFKESLENSCQEIQNLVLEQKQHHLNRIIKEELEFKKSYILKKQEADMDLDEIKEISEDIERNLDQILNKMEQAPFEKVMSKLQDKLMRMQNRNLQIDQELSCHRFDTTEIKEQLSLFFQTKINPLQVSFNFENKEFFDSFVQPMQKDQPKESSSKKSSNRKQAKSMEHLIQNQEEFTKNEALIQSQQIYKQEENEKPNSNKLMEQYLTQYSKIYDKQDKSINIKSHILDQFKKKNDKVALYILDSKKIQGHNKNLSHTNDFKYATKKPEKIQHNDSKLNISISQDKRQIQSAQLCQQYLNLQNEHSKTRKSSPKSKSNSETNFIIKKEFSVQNLFEKESKSIYKSLLQSTSQSDILNPKKKNFSNVQSPPEKKINQDIQKAKYQNNPFVSPPHHIFKTKQGSNGSSPYMFLEKYKTLNKNKQSPFVKK